MPATNAASGKKRGQEDFLDIVRGVRRIRGSDGHGVLRRVACPSPQARACLPPHGVRPPSQHACASLRPCGTVVTARRTDACDRARRQPTAHRSPAKLFSERLKMPRAVKDHQRLAVVRQRGTHARKRLNAGQTPRFCALSSPLPGHRFRRVYRFHPTPTGQNAQSESAIQVTPPQKNSFEKQTHLKVTLQCRGLTQTTIVRRTQIPAANSRPTALSAAEGSTLTVS